MLKIDYSSFEKIVKQVREYYKRLDKVENALGSICLENFYDLPNSIINEIEEATGVEWTDDIFEAIWDPKANCPIKDIWDKIQQLKENKGE